MGTSQSKKLPPIPDEPPPRYISLRVHCERFTFKVTVDENGNEHDIKRALKDVIGCVDVGTCPELVVD